jgi:hypothetical protein
MKTKISLSSIVFLLILVFPLFSQDASHKVKVVTEQANIRLEPDIGSRIILQSPQNTSLEAIGKQGEWYQVRFIDDKGKLATGYVHESLVIEMGPPPPQLAGEETKAPAQEKPPEKIEVEKVEPEKIEFTETEPEAETKPPAQAVETERADAAPGGLPPISLLLSLGFSYRVGGDINTGAQGLADFYADTLSSSMQGNVSPVHLAYLFGGELQMHLRPNLALGIGLDYFKGKKESTVTYPETTDSDAFTTTPELQSIPIRIALTYHILPEMNPAFYFKGGLEYHFASCAYHYRFDEAEAWEEWKGTASAQGFGFMAGLGFDVEISPTMVFFAEAAGNIAKISDFSGTNTYQDSTGYTSTEKGDLYIYQAQTQPEVSHTLLFIRERKPSEGGVSDAKLATLDYSGVWLRAGIRIRF